MGLSIHAVGRAEYLCPARELEDDEADGCVVAKNYECFRERLDGLPEGIYRVSGKEHFFSCSYGFVDFWRHELAQAALDQDHHDIVFNPAPFAGLPFYELLVMADTEGAIGPTTSAKLHRDFVTERLTVSTRIRQRLPEDEAEDWLYYYDQWCKAFELAKDGGLVIFR